MDKVRRRLVFLYHYHFLPYLKRRRFWEKLKVIDSAILSARPQDIPELFKDLSLDEFGELLMDVPATYPNLKAVLPSMVSDKDQDRWTGNHGWFLLEQSLVFVKSMLSGYSEITGKDIRSARVLDFGFGWGRLIRLLYKFVPYEQIYGVDPWDESLEVCRKHGLKAHLEMSDYIPYTIPFDLQFDLIFSFSVFTHLSEKTCAVALSTLRRHITDDGLLLITIRPRDYWSFFQKGRLKKKMTTLHDRIGFAFLPHKRSLVDGEITYGQTSISIDYFERNFPQWAIVKTTVNKEDPQQMLLFLRPV